MSRVSERQGMASTKRVFTARVLSLSLLGSLSTVHGFPLTPSRCTSVSMMQHDDALRIVNAVESTACVSKRIRWRTRYYFKPDDSVRLYGGDEEEDEDDEEDGVNNDDIEPDMKLMGAFVANRLARAYIRNKIQQMRNEDSSIIRDELESAKASINTAAVSRTVTDVVEASPEVLRADQSGDEKESETEARAETESEETPTDLPLADAKQNETEAAAVTDSEVAETEPETAPIVLPPADEKQNTAEAVAETEPETAMGTSKDDQSRANIEVSNETDDKTKDFPMVDAGEEKIEETESLTTEVPSLMHEKEGDRNIGLKDNYDFIETRSGDAADGEAGVWGGVPDIPQEISLEFGRPLQVVKESIPPISS